MKSKIQKRDGRLVPFDKEKIRIAILKAFQNVDHEITDYSKEKAERIADYIEQISENKTLTVEEVQDLVEKGLMSTKRKDVAKSFVLYRAERTKERNKKSKLIKEIGQKLRAENVQNQNANMDEKSFGGRKGEAANALMKQYALDYCMSDMAVKNHLNNEIYTHDLDSYAIGQHNCLIVPLDDLLANGFNTRQTDVRPANSVNTAMQLVAVIFQIQSLQQFGGVASSHLDWTMVPYVRKSFAKHYKIGMEYISNKPYNDNKWKNGDVPINNRGVYNDSKAYDYAINMTTREVEQAAEGMYHNLR